MPLAKTLTLCNPLFILQISENYILCDYLLTLIRSHLDYEDKNLLYSFHDAEKRRVGLLYDYLSVATGTLPQPIKVV